MQINTLLCSLLARRTPDELRLILIDPKRVELRPYRNIPHLLTPLILEPDKAKTVLQHACRELDRRTRILEEHGVRNIDGFNRLVEKMAADKSRKRRKKNEEESEIPAPLPRLVIVVDELADLFIHAKAEVTPAIQAAAQPGPRGGDPPRAGDPAPLDRHRERHAQGEPAYPHRLPGGQLRGLADHPGPGGRRNAARQGRHADDAAGRRPAPGAGRVRGRKEVGRFVKFWESAAKPVFDTGMLEEEQPLPFVRSGNGAIPAANGAAVSREDSMLPRARDLIIREQKASTSMLQTEMGLGYQRRGASSRNSNAKAWSARPAAPSRATSW